MVMLLTTEQSETSGLRQSRIQDSEVSAVLVRCCGETRGFWDSLVENHSASMQRIQEDEW